MFVIFSHLFLEFYDSKLIPFAVMKGYVLPFFVFLFFLGKVVCANQLVCCSYSLQHILY